MNTSTTRQRYTVITVNYSGYCDLIKDKTIKVLNTVRVLLENKISVYAMPYIYTCQIEHITEDQAIPQPEVKPDNFKPLQARVIGVNDPLDRLRQNRIKFEVGQLYDFGYNKGDTRIKIEIVTRTDKTITYKHYGFKVLYRRKIQDTDLKYETFYPDKNSICSSRDKVRESLPESQIKTVATTDNNLSTFKAGQVYKIGDRVDIALKITEANDKTVKVHFLIEVYDKKTDCWQWWESKENKTFRVTNFKTLQQITLNYSTFMNIGTVSVRSNQLSSINYQHSVKTAINNNSLPAEVKNKLLFLNGNRSGSYYSYDNK